ncbi:iron-sulfur cluster assembly scaffold protein [Candidatus Peregrinibacteria bacterium]|nr:iron-sulfur cluster assembly scaffold protein [Candidatus Peregrinibacteria bacterium]
MDLYAENILDHYRHPRHKLPLPKEAPPPTGEPACRTGRDQGGGVVIHHESNPACGDELTIRFGIKDDHIHNPSWDGTGCAISQAAMSMLAEEFENISIDSAAALTPKQIFDLLGVPISPRRLKCALLGLHALKNALHIHYGEPLQVWTQTVSGAVDEI